MGSLSTLADVLVLSPGQRASREDHLPSFRTGAILSDLKWTLEKASVFA